MNRNVLTDVKIKSLKFEKVTKVYDGQGLHMRVQPNGTKSWYMDYRFAGKSKTVGLGKYPEVSLRDARDKAFQLKKSLSSGIDPSVQKKLHKLQAIYGQSQTFAHVAEEYLEKLKKEKRSIEYIRRERLHLESYLSPGLGHLPIGQISGTDLYCELMKIVQADKSETAKRARLTAEKVFGLAVVTSRASINVAIGLSRLMPKIVKENYPAITSPSEFARLLVAIDGYEGTETVRAALKISALLFQRPGEIRKMKWSDLDFSSREWRYHVTKTKIDHIVPLPNQAVQILEDLSRHTGTGIYVFPGARSPRRPMSENAVNLALRNLGYTNEQMCAHGFRAAARTMLDECLNIPVDIIEHQLAHKVKDPMGRAYNRTKKLDQRKSMMQTWADFLDSQKNLYVVSSSRASYPGNQNIFGFASVKQMKASI